MSVTAIDALTSGSPGSEVSESTRRRPVTFGDRAEADHGGRICDRDQRAERAVRHRVRQVDEVLAVDDQHRQHAGEQRDDQRRLLQGVVQRERDAQHCRERNQSGGRVRQPARLRLRVAVTHVVAFARGERAADHPLEPDEARDSHDQGDDQADLPRGVGGRAEVLHRDPVLDFRGARGRHGERDRAEADGAGNEAPRQAGLAEQRQRERKHRERHHEQAHAAVGEDGAGADDGDQRVPRAESLHDPLRDAVGGAAVFHHLAEDGAEQEDEEPRGNETAEPRHVGGGEVVGAGPGELRHQRQAEGQRQQQGADGRRQQQVDAAHSEHDEQCKTAEQSDPFERHAERDSGRGTRPRQGVRARNSSIAATLTDSSSIGVCPRCGTSTRTRSGFSRSMRSNVATARMSDVAPRSASVGTARSAANNDQRSGAAADGALRTASPIIGSMSSRGTPPASL